VVVVIVTLVLLAAVLLPAFLSDRPIPAHRIVCLNNLKQIGLAFRFWADDHDGRFPFEIPITNGGTLELAATGDALATFQIMSNELSNPKLLLCPADTNHVLATSFGAGLSTKNVSYFIGLDAIGNKKNALLSGDDNFERTGTAIKPGLQFISANTMYFWDTDRHNRSGNIGLADGSVQRLKNSDLLNLFRQTGFATNRLAIP
jgi:prepilin-type processing-associated H-X9-DG protein